MIGNQDRRSLECPEGRAQRIVTIVGGPIEAVVRRHLFGRLPHALDWIELRRVRWQAEQLDPMTVFGEPSLSLLVEVMTGAVVDDQEGLSAPTATHDLLEKPEERARIEHRRKLMKKSWTVFKRDHAEHVRRLA